jgi:eukaryotic-like serine/threonine-protein kinase
MADHIGRVLGGRYRLMAPVGTGASASVFLADDVTLRRRVAVKVLHAALADDDAFLRRFRAEAQAAAALNHPHVLAVYDWGQDEVPYLVTEFLGGGSLRAVLDRGHRLTPSQALLVGLQAARALDYAHRRGFVHRDIKPANLLFGDDGRLRIADFGLARALAEAAWTEPAGAVLGTARYASPEQAMGESVTGKADVYALGLVLIEAVTGSVPFAADTTIATLMARIDRPVPVPAALGPMARALERAGRPDAHERPDAAAFGAALMASAGDLPRPAPLPLAGAGVPDIDLTLADRDPTMLPAPAPERARAPVVGDPTPMPAPQRPPRPSRRDRRDARQRERKAKQLAGLKRSRRRWPLVVVAVLLVLGATGAGAAALLGDRVPTHPVPRLVGSTEQAATEAATARNWVVRTTTTRRDGSEPGEVLAQDPQPGTDLAEGEPVTLVVSLGNTLVVVPRGLRGQQQEAAEAALTGAGLAVGTVSTQHSEEAERGVVLDVEDVADRLPRGTSVDLVVSSGPEPRTVPSGLSGGRYDDAAAAIEAAGLVPVRVERFDNDVPAGIVIGTSPAPGTSVERGGEVAVAVSIGPPLVEVPDVHGMTLGQAVAVLRSEGLSAGSVSGSATGVVDHTSPVAGELVPLGGTVNVILVG